MHAVAHKKGLVTEKKTEKKLLGTLFLLLCCQNLNTPKKYKPDKIASQMFTEHKLLIIFFPALHFLVG